MLQLCSGKYSLCSDRGIVAKARITTPIFCWVPLSKWQAVGRSEWHLFRFLLLWVAALPCYSAKTAALCHSTSLFISCDGLHTSQDCRQGRPLSFSSILSVSPSFLSLASGCCLCLLGISSPAGAFLPCVDNQVCNLKLQEIQTNLSRPAWCRCFRSAISVDGSELLLMELLFACFPTLLSCA